MTLIAFLRLAFLTILEHSKEAGIPLEFASLFDQAAGTTKVREYFMGLVEKPSLISIINEHLAAFITQAQKALYYQPLPVINAL